MPIVDFDKDGMISVSTLAKCYLIISIKNANRIKISKRIREAIILMISGKIRSIAQPQRRRIAPSVESC